MNKHIITFDTAAQSEILNLLELGIDEQGYIVEKACVKNKVLSQSDGAPIQVKELGAIKKGSIQLFKKDLPSLIDLSDRL